MLWSETEWDSHNDQSQQRARVLKNEAKDCDKPGNKPPVASISPSIRLSLNDNLAALISLAQAVQCCVDVAIIEGQQAEVPAQIRCQLLQSFLR